MDRRWQNNSYDSTSKRSFFLLASEKITKQCFKRWVDYFLLLTNHSEVSHPDHIKSHPVLIAKLSQALHILSRLLHKPIFHNFIIELGYNLNNYYQFQVITSVKVLQNMISYAKIQNNLHLWAFASERCGDLKYRLGHIDEAMKLYRKAEGHYRSVQYNLGLANVLKSMGDLYIKNNEIEKAIDTYNSALSFYKMEKNKLGLAYTVTQLCYSYSLFGSCTEVHNLAQSILDIIKEFPCEHAKKYI